MSHLASSSQHHSTLHSCYLHHCIATIEGHNCYVSSLAIGGHFLFAGSSDKEIRLWNLNGLISSHAEQESIADAMVVTGNGAVKSMVVSSDKLFTAHQDHKIRVWKISSHETKLTHLATLPTLGDRALKLLIPKHHVQVRRHKKSTWVHHLDTVSALALSNDGSLLYSVSWDRTLKIWQTSDFKCLQSVANAHDDAINAVASSSNGDVYTGSADKKIRVWRKMPPEGTDVLTLVSTLEKHKSGINALALSSDGNMLYSGASDRSIVVWEKNGGGSTVAMGTLRGHKKAILCLTVVSDLVCSGSADETIRLWRGVDKCYFCLALLEGHNGPVKCLTLAKDEDDPSSYLIYSGGLDCHIKVWRIFVGCN
ncbi:protein JINGUBANG-like [Cynara cardunculus var. scolymus]|uniref:protein JINGUBANG-like n=1 Tax=Cynara cardunculus var. scolymus TaxID=59895 RepID=UPI000D6230E7|nr:protein JINGUBANG-like [Cynara cardunculus var. scolymus]